MKKYIKSEKPFSYEGKINTNFHSIKVKKEGAQYISLSVILINSVFRTDKNYYPHMFLEECKYVIKQKKMPKYINKDIEISSYGFDKEDSYVENSDEENSDDEYAHEIFSNSYWRTKIQKGREYCSERYKNLSDDDTQRLIEYRKRHYEMQNNNFKVTQKGSRFLAIRIGENAAIRIDKNAATTVDVSTVILAHPNMFKIEYIKFLYKVIWWEIIFTTIFSK